MITQAYELRIGNWIQVLGIYKDSYKKAGLIQCDAELIKLSADSKILLMPVTLSHEILEKCGAVGITGMKHEIGDPYFCLHNSKKQHDYEFNTYDKYSFYGYWADDGFIKESVPIQYLHKLQNLYYALTAEELNIQL